MSSAAEIARKALEEEQRPERERKKKADEEARVRANRKAAREKHEATRRLNNSVIPKWFSGVQWKFIEHFYGQVQVWDEFRKKILTFHMDVWESGSGYELIRLGVYDNNILFLDTYPDTSPHRAHETRWTGYIVNSVADVARQKDSYENRHQMPDYLP